ncbi:MAG: Ig domain-containing protein [Planctomycetota bacterium]
MDGLTDYHEIQRVEFILAADLGPGEFLERHETIALPDGLDAEVQVLVYTDATNVVFEDQAEESGNVAAAPVAVYAQQRQLAGDATLSFNLDDGQEFDAGVPLSFSGQAAVPPGSLNAIFLLDLSGSTRLITGLDANFDGVVDDADDLNSDGRVGDLLDREIGLVIESVSRLQQSAPDLRVAVVGWTQSNIAFENAGEPLDLGSKRFNQTFFEPGRAPHEDADFEIAVRSVSTQIQGTIGFSQATAFRNFVIGPGNNYDEGLQELLSILDAAPEADATQVYYFSDGLFVTSEDILAQEETIAAVGARGVQFRAAQVAGRELIDQHCGGASPASFCSGIDLDGEFVGEVQRIVEGINADPSSNADVVLAESPEDLDQVLFTPARPAGVTINGAAVESFDAAGNFFSTVTLESGPNLFTTRVIDSTGRETEQQLTLLGSDGSNSALESFDDVTASSALTFFDSTFNRRTQVLHARSSLQNHGNGALRGPVRAVFEQLNPSSIDLLNSESDELGRSYAEFTREIPVGGLPSEGVSSSVALEFANLKRERFDVDVSILALGNSAPQFRSSPLANAVLGVDYRYESTAIDPDGDSLVYSLEVGPDGLSVDAASGAVSWTPNAEQIGVHTVRLRASDGHGGSTNQVFQIDLLEEVPNRPPVFQSSPPTNAAIGGLWSYTPLVSDADGDVLQFFLDQAPAGTSIDSASGVVLWDPTVEGEHPVTIRVDDSAGGSASQSFLLSVGEGSDSSRAPVLLSTPPTLGAVGQQLFYLPLVQDPDSDELTFSSPTTPDGANIDPRTGRIEWVPTDSQVGPNSFLLRVDDGQGNFATQFFVVEIQLNPPNLPPVFTSLPKQIATAGEQYEYIPSVLDGHQKR